MRAYLHRGHTVTDIKYHFVWVTKYRYPVLTREVGLRVRELVRQTCEARGVTIVTGGVRSRKGIAAPGLARPHAARSSTIVASTSSLAAPRAGGRRSLSPAAVRGSRMSSTHHAAATRRDQSNRSSKRPALR